MCVAIYAIKWSILLYRGWGMAKEALGQSEAFLDFQEQLSLVAPVDRPVLLIGERGTGKELAAARLHFLSLRWQRPFVTLNCATLSAHLIESELFGHDRGAFTGAERTKEGRFEAANGGTLFLDEIGSIPLEVQEKILRVVEYGSFERVGSSKSSEVDVRIVGATNEDLPRLAEQGLFKRDLLDRLSFEVLFLPPLRFRGEDIMFLAHHFSSRMSFELGRSEPVLLGKGAEKQLKSYPWPGNIRELKNVVERAVYRCETGVIDDITFDPFISPFLGVKDDSSRLPGLEKKSLDQGIPDGKIVRVVSYKEAMEQFERSLLKSALTAARHNQKRAARRLGLSYDQFRGKLRKYGGLL
jgi:psp operon transcriptional activator